MTEIKQRKVNSNRIQLTNFQIDNLLVDYMLKSGSKVALAKKYGVHYTTVNHYIEVNKDRLQDIEKLQHEYNNKLMLQRMDILNKSALDKAEMVLDTITQEKLDKESAFYLTGAFKNLLSGYVPEETKTTTTVNNVTNFVSFIKKAVEEEKARNVIDVTPSLSNENGNV